MKELLNIFVISLVVLTGYIAIRVYREKKLAKRKQFTHFKYLDLYWNAKKNAWQLKIELFQRETLVVSALNEEKEKYYEQSFVLEPGELIVSLDSKDFRKAEFVEIKSNNKVYTKSLK